MKSGKREGKGVYLALTRGESTCKQEVKGRRFQLGKGLALRITADLKKKHG
jgi:hypothetical protein